jgi:hypothetical protein
MATSIAAPNLQRLSLPEIDLSYESKGIISLIDEVVERVMKAHMKKSCAAPTFEAKKVASYDEVVNFPAHSSYYSVSSETSEAAA